MQGILAAPRSVAFRPVDAQVRIEPEPTEAERLAILAALALDPARTHPGRWSVEMACAVDVENTQPGPPTNRSAPSA